jgi:hypothetical protein
LFASDVSTAGYLINYFAQFFPTINNALNNARWNRDRGRGSKKVAIK